MSSLSTPRRLIVNADDFGRSESINEAVLRSHRDGILTTASLMVNEPGFEEAVAIARQNPRLGVGLHLTFVCGRSALPPKVIPGLVNARGEFSNQPAAAGARFFFDRGLRQQLRAEIHAQFAKFHETGLRLDHVNGHLHLHLHPTVFRILSKEAKALGIRSMRLTVDPLGLNLRLAGGRFLYRLSHAAIFRLLSMNARPYLCRGDHRFTTRVFGLLQDGRVDEPYVCRLLSSLPPGDSELYSHPSLHEFKHEFEALISPKVLKMVRDLGIQLIRYQDLYDCQTAVDSAHRAGL